MAYTVTVTPQFLQPVYNPIVFKFTSTNFSAEGFRYTISLTDTNRNLQLATLKVVPQADGIGYIDIQKILSNSVSVDFIANMGDSGNAANSYINYGVSFGEEFTYIFPFHQVSEVTAGTASIISRIRLTNTGGTIPLYVTNDQVVISSPSTGITSVINGLHTVLSATSNSIIIDVFAPDALTGTTNVSGTTRYADNRKVITNNLAGFSGLTAFNGALDWDEWKVYNVGFFITQTGTSGTFLLTSLNELDTSKKENRVYLTQTQEAWLNYYTTVPAQNLALKFNYFEGGVLTQSGVTAVNTNTTGTVKTVKIGYNYYGITPSSNGTEKYVDFSLARTTTPFASISRSYRFYLDERCKRNEYEIVFLDRWGSLLSIPLQLKDSETSEIKRVTSKKAILYSAPGQADLLARGSDISNVDYEKTFTLTSNWMNDAQMKLFDEMLSSPFTYLRKNFFNYAGGGDVLQYYSCIVQDGGTEIVKQKNKRIFNKTVSVQLANQMPINI